MVGRPYEGPLLIEIDQLLEQGYCPDGWVDVELEDTRLVCLIHQSRPYLAGLVEPGRFSGVPLGDVVLRANRMEGAVCSLFRADPVQVLLMATHFRHPPELQASTRYVDLIHVLDVLAVDGHDAALALERTGRRTLMFLRKGMPARLYFGDGKKRPEGGDITNQFLLYGFAPKSPEGRVEVFSKLVIDPDPDTGRTFRELVAEAKPPPAMNILVHLDKRVELQRPFMPPSMVIGRDHTCELVLQSLSISRRHAKLSWTRGRFMVEDLGSANGTTVNGRRIQRTVLEPGDRVGVGVYEVKLVARPEEVDLKSTMMLVPGNFEKTLYLTGEKQSVPLTREVSIGRGLGADLVAWGAFVRDVHARIRIEGSGVYHLVCPGRSTVKLNGRRVRSAYVKEGDELAVGKARFRFVVVPHKKSK
jgi:pSer/pThr/pTyr-binding forkhead associated (FHA) protein